VFDTAEQTVHSLGSNLRIRIVQGCLSIEIQTRSSQPITRCNTIPEGGYRMSKEPLESGQAIRLPTFQVSRFFPPMQGGPGNTEQPTEAILRHAQLGLEGIKGRKRQSLPDMFHPVDGGRLPEDRTLLSLPFFSGAVFTTHMRQFITPNDNSQAKKEPAPSLGGLFL